MNQSMNYVVKKEFLKVFFFNEKGNKTEHWQWFEFSVFKTLHNSYKS